MGPQEVSNRSQAQGDCPVVICDFTMSPFSTGERRARSRHDRRNMEMGQLLETIVRQSMLSEMLNKTQITISVTVLEADGGAESCAINAVMLALADAGTL